MVSSLNSGQPAGGVRAPPPNPEVAYQAQLQQLTQVFETSQIFYLNNPHPIQLGCKYFILFNLF